MTVPAYFIKHPVVTWVLNALLLLLGVLCLQTVPVQEYPQVTYPTIFVSVPYPNASPQLVESAVTNVLENKLAGVSGLETMTSSSLDGDARLTLHFRIGTNLDQAMTAVRDAVALAQNQMPKEVRDPLIERKTPSHGGPPFFVVALESTTLDFGALTHYAELNLRNVFRSLKGVASADVWGQPYTYEILLDPHKMALFHVNADEVYHALSQSRFSQPVGKFRGQVPTTLNTELSTLTDYEDCVIKEKDPFNPKGAKQAVLLKSIANVSLKVNNKTFRVRINGNPGLCLGIERGKDANPLEVSNLLRAKIGDLQKTLPPGISLSIVTDQGDFIRASLKGIQASIFEAIVLVLGIVFLFLRSVRATLVPLMTIPISLMGAIIFLKIFGFSLNILTLLAMVLAVGLVVDDAIVVLENIARHIEEGKKPVQAALLGSKEIAFAIIAMTLTLASVYAPIAFIEGAVGQLFIEFAVALAGSVLISGIVALTLSPLMCARVLKPLSQSRRETFLPQVDVFLGWLGRQYGAILETLLSFRKLAVLFVGLCMVGTFLLLQKIPHELVPREDRGLVGVHVPPIPGKDMDTMERTMIRVEDLLKPIKEAQSMLTFMGHWGGVVVLPLVDLSQRTRSPQDIVAQMRPLAANLPSTDAFVWSHDTGLPGLDASSGTDELTLVIRTTDPYRTLFEHVEAVKKALDEMTANGQKLFEGVRHDLALDTPGYRIDLNQNRMAKLNLRASQIAKTIEIFFSGDQTLSTQIDGIPYALTLKGKQEPWSLEELYVHTPTGVRISLGALATLKPIAQPKDLSHFNQMRAVMVTATIRKGDTLASSMPKFLQAVADKLPPTYQTEWTGAAKALTESSTTLSLVFVLALVFIYGILAIQFERFLDPFIVLMTVPLAGFGALLFVWLLDQSLNVYTQVGLITLIGLITKHGILIVEFTNQLASQGTPLAKAVQQAAQKRLRPILMTSMAMIIGTIPLILSHTAGFEARRAIGITLIGGLLIGTIFTLFVIPTLTYALKSRLQKHP